MLQYIPSWLIKLSLGELGFIILVCLILSAYQWDAFLRLRSKQPDGLSESDYRDLLRSHGRVSLIFAVMLLLIVLWFVVKLILPGF